jgi:hypothetical protein
MILEPINGQEFSRACRVRVKSPAPCQWRQFLRLVALVAVGGMFVSLSFPSAKAKAETHDFGGRHGQG